MLRLSSQALTLTLSLEGEGIGQEEHPWPKEARTSDGFIFVRLSL
jgi:hypothetical protein